MAYETLLLEREGATARLILNRPQVLNALNGKLLEELADAVGGLRADREIRVVILTGAGDKAFAAGADLNELALLSPLEAVEFARRGQRVFRDLETLGKPSIAAVNGFALGGGCELAMSCTLRVAAESARLGQPEVNLGIIPGYGGTQRLTRLVGKGRALDLILTGRMVGAGEALAMGLVNQTAPDAGLPEAAKKLAGTLLEKGPLALRFAMQAVHGGLEMGFEDALEWEAHLFGLAVVTEDMKEGTRAFLEKRKPTFRGR